MSEVKFNALRAKILALESKREELRSSLTSQYGAYQTSWLTPSERAKLEKLAAQINDHSDRFFELLDSISPRSWRSGVSYWWIITQLTYSDAVTRGELSVMPQIAFGSGEREMLVFMRPVK